MRNRAMWRLLAALVIVAAVSASCGDDDSAGDGAPDPAGEIQTTDPPVADPPVADPPATVPPVTEPPATAPPVTEPPTTAPEPANTITLDLVDGQLVGGVREESVPLGEEVTIVATGNTDGEIHIHGYDRFVELTDGSGEVTFPAEIPGIFEVELEATGRLLIRLEVS